jgi:hypothetical protein
MVVRRVLFFALCLLSTGTVFAETGITMSIDSPRVEYGKSFLLTLHSQKPSPALNSLDLQSQLTDFVAEPVNTAELSSADPRRRQWRLYARHPGKITIPALHIGYQQTRPASIEVTPAVDPRTGNLIDVTMTISDQAIWVRQAVYVRMNLTTKSSIVALKLRSFSHEALENQQLDTTHTRSQNQKGLYHHQIGWAVIPRREGGISIQPPPVEYVRDGIVTHRFYPPRLDLTVRALPAYLPPDIPVGKVSLQYHERTHFLFTGSLDAITLTMKGTGILASDLPLLETQLASNNDIQIYPVRKNIEQRTSQSKLTSQVTYQVPVSAQSSGLVMLPVIRLAYFDPQQGKLVSQQPDNIRVYAINRPLLYILSILALVGIGLFGKAFIPTSIRYLRRRIDYIRILSQLPNVESGEKLTLLLREQATIEGWSHNLTLLQWQKFWRQAYGRSPWLDEAVENLNHYRYADEPLDLPRTKKQFLRIMSRSHPLLYRLARVRQKCLST